MASVEPRLRRAPAPDEVAEREVAILLADFATSGSSFSRPSRRGSFSC